MAFQIGIDNGDVIVDRSDVGDGVKPAARTQRIGAHIPASSAMP